MRAKNYNIQDTVEKGLNVINFYIISAWQK